MLKKINLMVLFILMMCILFGCSTNDGFNESLKIIGDVEETTDLNEIWSDLNTNKIDYDDSKITCVEFNQIFNNVKLIYSEFDIMLVVEEGNPIFIAGNELNNAYLGKSNEDNWVYISANHPDNGNIKNIKAIIILRATDNSPTAINYSYGLNIVYDDTTLNYSLGELYQSSYATQTGPIISKQDFLGDTYSEEAKEEKNTLQIADIFDNNFDQFLIMDGTGGYEYFTADCGYIELAGNSLNYVDIENRVTYSDLKGIYINPPQTTVMDAYYDSLYYLEKNQDVMVLFIDGFSYYQCQQICDEHNDYYISGLMPDIEKANSIYKPVTNAGFAAMITGVPPIENGVLNRSYREVKAETIFEKAQSMGKSAVLVEGDIEIIDAGIKPILNIDTNDDGYTDDEIFTSALDAIETEPNYILVHFHSFDDSGHNYGAYSNETLGRMAVLEQYIKELSTKWDGKIILTADHGMHTTSDGGSHGEFRAEDLTIPYIIYDGGKINE